MIISLVGVDNCGKTTILNSLADYLRAKGEYVSVLNWKIPLAKKENGPVSQILNDSLLNFYKLFISMNNITDDDGMAQSLVENFPKSYTELKSNDVYNTIMTNARFSSTPGLFYCLTVMELSYFIIMYHYYVVPFINEKRIFLADSWIYKNIIKDLGLLKMCILNIQGCLNKFEQFRANILSIIDCLNIEDIIFCVDADIELTSKWRGSKKSLFEAGRIVGSNSNDPYKDFQQTLRIEYSNFAKTKKWPVIRMRDVEKSINIANALSEIKSHTCL